MAHADWRREGPGSRISSLPASESSVVSTAAATRTFSLNVFLTRAPDVEGQWVGHCLEVDVVSQGQTMREAFEATREAVELVILDDLGSAREPTQRSAPREEWEAAYALVRTGNPRLYTLRELFENEQRLRYALAPLILNFASAPNLRPASLQELNAHPLAQAA
jgi:predicted RNase H-like HicB family nuclease